MARQSNQKLKLLYLLKILWEETDEENALTMREIIADLNRYGIFAERKSIYDDIEKLQFFGVDIVTRKNRTTEYFIAKRPFEIPELKLLIDAVQSSNFITLQKSKELIKKLTSLTSKHQAKPLKRHIYVADRAKTINESIYYNVDALHNAINENKQISFKYFHYTVNKEKTFLKEGKHYVTSPYNLIWDNENYYLVAYSDKYKNYTHYRVDRMSNIEVLNQIRKIPPANKQINIADYSKKTFNMYGGEEQTVEIKFDLSLVNVVIDRFGHSVNLKKIDDRNFVIKTKVFVSPTFFSWIFQFRGKAQILSPKHVVERYLDKLELAKMAHL